MGTEPQQPCAEEGRTKERCGPDGPRSPESGGVGTLAGGGRQRGTEVASRRHKPKAPRRLEPSVDVDESFAAGAGLLESTGVPYALIGRVAVWRYVEPGGQQLTKDVDFAVPRGYADEVASEARRLGFKVHDLSIGGYGFSRPGIVIDVVDRRGPYEKLFAEAVQEAQDNRDQSGTPVAPMDYLIAMKLIPGTDKDDRDVEELLLELPDADYDELRKLVFRHLGELAANRLDNLARRAGHPGPGRRQERYRT